MTNQGLIVLAIAPNLDTRLFISNGVKTNSREVQVYFAHRGIFVPDDVLVSRPRKKLSVYRIAVVVRRDADLIAALETDMLRLGPPFFRLTRLACHCGLDCLVLGHRGEFAVPDFRDPLVPGIDHATESDQLIHLGATVLTCEPDWVEGG